MATQIIELQKLKAIILERVIEHLQEQTKIYFADSISDVNREQAEELLVFIGNMLVNELIINKEKE